MAKLRDIYHYENPRFSPLRDAARRATAAYQNAARGLDTLKEWVLVEFGLVHTADAIHRLAHEQPKRFDVIGDILHQRHLMQEYPETPEYRERPEDMDGVFGEVIRLLEDIEDALRDCVGASEEVGLYPLAREFETFRWRTAKATRPCSTHGRCMTRPTAAPPAMTTGWKSCLTERRRDHAVSDERNPAGARKNVR